MSIETEAIRRASRRLVRELGFLGAGLAGTTLAPSAVHALVELARNDLSAKDIAQLLLLDKSSVSRLLAKLSDEDLLREESDAEDGRRKKLALTRKGRTLAAFIDDYADSQVTRALAKLDAPNRMLVRRGLEAYASGLESARLDIAPSRPQLEIVSGYRPGAIGAVVALHARYYARHWRFGAAFEAKVAAGLADFVGRLDRPNNEMWLAVMGDDIVGSAAVDGEDLGDGKAHLRWVIVDEVLQGQGVGRRLLERALAFADARAFRETHLWTFAGLDAARALYERAGFSLSEEWRGDQWGTEVTEQRFLRLRPTPPI
ncbi:bifunctional helix-turn-helix transcriptional regulator/GNAT family N-acetyltransferase [Rhizobium sp. FKL33]|uniref:bifunctional helix-turn-helix transcriptional regulator/GNAT family N-acetyltransferase n=1 Tax=Rhizobium sp. FKL33 TaxID=2562307 RepID=UPI0010C14ED1|nr:bifunctional helix-turn-helix transcriptional regulator/GNAT family N-acetyltransferase [Rhizobium sp. FKL33]